MSDDGVGWGQSGWECEASAEWNECMEHCEAWLGLVVAMGEWAQQQALWQTVRSVQDEMERERMLMVQPPPWPPWTSGQ